MVSFVEEFEGTKAVKGVDVVRGLAEIRQAAKDLEDSIPYNYAMQALGFPEIHAHRNPYVFARQLKEDYAVRLPHHDKRFLYPWLNVTLTNRKDVIEKYVELEKNLSQDS